MMTREGEGTVEHKPEDGREEALTTAAPTEEAVASKAPQAEGAASPKGTQVKPKRPPVFTYIFVGISLLGAFFLPFATYLCFLVLLAIFISTRIQKRPFPRPALILALVALAGAIVNSAVAYSQYTQGLL